MMKPTQFLFLSITFFFLAGKIAVAQDETTPPPQPPQPSEENFWDKIYIGGNFGLQFGTTTVINVSPQIGYRVTEKFVPGIGLTYIYYNFKDPYSNSRYETNIYGGSIFGKYFFTQNLFAHAEFEELNLEGLTYPNGNLNAPLLTRLWVPSIFVGAGYNQPLGKRGFLQLLILFEVLQDRNSPYYRNNPVVRIGFGF